MRNKINIVSSRQEVTDEELERFKNFDSLLTTHYRVLNEKKPVSGRFIFAFAILIGLAIGYWIYPHHTNSKSNGNKMPADSLVLTDKKETGIDTTTKSVKPKSEKVESLKREEMKSVQPPVLPERKIEAGVDSATIENSESNTVIGQASPEPVNAPKTETVYVQAQPVNGYEALYEYFSKELIYPEAAVKDSIEGVLTVKFLINKEGKPEKIQTSGSLGVLFDKEAVRLIEHMPLWKPATVNGKPITSKLSLPLTFQLRNQK